jgi:hypothetical protein
VRRQPDQFDPQAITGSQEAVAALADRASAESLVSLLVPMLWHAGADGRPGNICVSAAEVVRHAYGFLGIAAQTLPIGLVIERAGAPNIRYGPPDPHWEGDDVFVGHCIVWLPNEQRFADLTAEQFPELARRGPVIGRAVIASGSGAGEFAGSLPPGSDIQVRRSNVTLHYTAVGPEYTTVIADHTQNQRHQPAYRRGGANLAAHTLSVLRIPEVVDRARRTPHRRVRDLLAVIGDADYDTTDDDWGFVLPDSTGVLRTQPVYQIPLPPGTQGAIA